MLKPTEIHWKRIAAESIAVVMSILLAFAIDAWWDEKSDRAEEIQYLTALHRDFQITALELEDQIERASRTMRRVDRVLEMISSDDGLQLPDEFSNAVGEAYSIGRPNFITATYQDMVNSGSLRLVRNEQVRLAMADLVGLLDTIDYHALLINETYWTHHATYIDKNLVVSEFGWFTAGSGENSESFASTPQSKFDIDLEAIRSRTFWNLMFDWKVMHGDMLDPLIDGRNRCDELLKLISFQLEFESR